MLLVLFAISVLTFLIFNVIPGGDPAVRLAGKQPQPEQLERIREEWGFNEPVYVQYVEDDGPDLHRRRRVLQRSATWSTRSATMPRTFSLAIGAAIIWMVFAVGLGLYGDPGGKVRRPVPDRPGDDRGLHAGVLDRRAHELLPRVQGGDLSQRRIRGVLRQPHRLGLSPDPAWTALSLLFIGIYSRLLRSSVLDTMHEDYVRTARAKG